MTLRMLTIQTQRLLIEPLKLTDAEFLYALFNDAEVLQFIGNKGITSVVDAEQHIQHQVFESYQKFGFGMWLVRDKRNKNKLGLCGLVNRPQLADVDIGFAFTQQARGQGFAYEAAKAVLEYAQSNLGLNKIVAITSQENCASQKLLQKLGMSKKGQQRLDDDHPPVLLFTYSG